MGYIQPTSEGNMGSFLEIIYGLFGEPQCFFGNPWRLLNVQGLGYTL